MSMTARDFIQVALDRVDSWIKRFERTKEEEIKFYSDVTFKAFQFELKRALELLEEETSIVKQIRTEIAAICKRHTNEFGELKCGHEIHLLNEIKSLAVEPEMQKNPSEVALKG